jgi:SWI/SNF-related matrix-associated actin-dependent regulator 1 of chromatin subfamily A
MQPKPSQLTGAAFLSARPTALLADLPRVGKTGSAIMAADDLFADTILVVTTASGCGVWRAGFADWSPFGRRVQVLAGGAALRPETKVCIVSWGAVVQAGVRAQLLKREWDLLILDEAHAAKNFEAKRTQAVYGVLREDGDILFRDHSLAGHAAGVWALTGTPLPNCPLDAYPMMRALCPERLAADPAHGWPDVSKLSDFTERYCKMRPMKVGKRGPWSKTVQVFVEGRNLAELRARLDGWFLQRTQQDVGILQPEYELMPLDAPLAANVADCAAFANADLRKVLDAAERGDTRALEMHLGPLRRLTGEIKAHAIVDAVREEFDAGLDKIVLAYWHKDVGQILLDGLSRFGVVGIDGATPIGRRAGIAQRFRDDPKCRVFLGQIQAAGEAIDLSAAAHMIFVESSLVPKDMLQMSLRVSNHTQSQQPLVRVAALVGSIDDALQKILMRKWLAIKEVIG